MSLTIIIKDKWHEGKRFQGQPLVREIQGEHGHPDVMIVDAGLTDPKCLDEIETAHREQMQKPVEEAAPTNTKDPKVTAFLREQLQHHKEKAKRGGNKKYY